jgi:hypothetical protein
MAARQPGGRCLDKECRMIAETVREYVFEARQGDGNAFGPAFFEEHRLVVRAYARTRELVGS